MEAQKPKPEWLKVKIPGGRSYQTIKQRMRTQRLYTVCEEAHCPNIGECWSQGTATFMVMGELCTRGCRFCHVKSGKPETGWLDPDEPRKVAESVRTMGLSYIVITSVDRDDLSDGGAAHFAATVREVKAHNPGIRVETLIPDFAGDLGALRILAEAGPDVIAHNIETVRRLTPRVRDRRASFDQSLNVLRNVALLNPAIYRKSSIMVGLGETDDEVLETAQELFDAGVRLLTIGQYLRPSRKQLPVERYVPPADFARYEAQTRSIGFEFVASGPMVRSSYRAGELFVMGRLERQNPT